MNKHQVIFVHIFIARLLYNIFLQFIRCTFKESFSEHRLKNIHADFFTRVQFGVDNLTAPTIFPVLSINVTSKQTTAVNSNWTLSLPSLLHTLWHYVRSFHHLNYVTTCQQISIASNEAYIGRCTWSNGYRRRNWTRRHEFKSWTRLIAFHIALIPLGKVWIQLFSLQLWVNSRTD